MSILMGNIRLYLVDFEWPTWILLLLCPTKSADSILIELLENTYYKI